MLCSSAECVIQARISPQGLGFSSRLMSCTCLGRCGTVQWLILAYVAACMVASAIAASITSSAVQRRWSEEGNKGTVSHIHISSKMT